MRNHVIGAALLVSVVGLACSGGEESGGTAAEESPPASVPAQSAPSTAGSLPDGGMPDWFRVDGDAVEMDITAGSTADNNYWNFNGGTNGGLTITVPTGARVTLNFTNADPNMAHSVGVAPVSATSVPTPAAEPVFAGAISGDPTSMTESTLSGESETLSFTADEPGEYALLCYIPGHALTGMWIRFTVGGEAGVALTP